MAKTVRQMPASDTTQGQSNQLQRWRHTRGCSRHNSLPDEEGRPLYFLHLSVTSPFYSLVDAISSLRDMDALGASLGIHDPGDGRPRARSSHSQGFWLNLLSE